MKRAEIVLKNGRFCVVIVEDGKKRIRSFNSNDEAFSYLRELQIIKTSA